MKKYRSILIGIVLVTVAGGLWFWGSRAQAASVPEPLEATGVIESRQANLSAEVGGLVVEVLVEAGERVTTGQPLVHLDDSLLQSQRAQALAALQAAQAQLTLLESGATAEQIAAAEAQLAGAQANERAAQANLDALESGATAEQIAAAEAQLAAADANMRTAQTALDALIAGTRPEAVAAIQASLVRARDGYYTMKVVFAAGQVEKVRSALTIAEGNRSAAGSRRDDLAADNRNPAFILASADAAVAGAEAAAAVAEQAYDLVSDGTQPYYLQIELARQSWEAAQANQAQMQARYDGLLGEESATPDARDAFQATLEDARDLDAAAKDAYEALTSGIAARQLEAAWDEVQRLQAQLTAFALVRPAAGGAVPAVETLLAQIDAAAAQRDLAQANLDALHKGARSEEIAAAQAQVDAAAAQRDLAQANLDARLKGARSEEIAAAQAQVDIAQAQLETIDRQLAKFTLTAPWDGILLTRSVEPGETALPGAILLKIGRLDLLELTVYLPEDRFGLVTLGQEAEVRVDVYPDQVFTGTVLRVADEAEFTPTNIQTKDDRTRLVYAVVISLDNPDLLLKPGLIADATFGE